MLEFHERFIILVVVGAFVGIGWSNALALVGGFVGGWMDAGKEGL